MKTTLISFVLLAVTALFAEPAVVPLQVQAQAMAFSPDHAKIYVVGTGGLLDVVDAQTKTRERTIVLDENPFSFAPHICVNDTFGIIVPMQTRGGSLLSRMYQIDPVTYSVRSASGYSYSGCAFNQDGQIVYVAHWNGSWNEFLGFDKNLNIVRRSRIPAEVARDIDSGPPCIERSPINGNKFYATLTSSPYRANKGWLATFNGQDPAQPVLMPQSPNGTIIPQKIFFRPDGKFAYITGWDAAFKYLDLTVVNVTTDEIVDFLPLGTFTNIKFVTDTLAYFTWSPQVGVWDLLQNKVVQQIDVPKYPDDPDAVLHGLELIPGQGNEPVDTLIVLKSNKLVFMEYKRPAPLKPPFVTNGASFSVRPIAPGEIASIFGEGLSTSVEGAMGFPLPTELGRTKVLVNKLAAPLFYVSPTQINFFVPFETPSPTSVDLVIIPDTTRPGNQIAFKVSTVRSDIGAFSTEIDGAWRPIVVNASRTPWELVSPSHPVMSGEWITLYLTGLGAVTPAVPSGQPAPLSPLSRTVYSATVKINAQEAQVGFCGLAPGWAGLYQINVFVPADLQGGLHLLEISTGYSQQFILLPVGTGGLTQ